MKEKVRVLVNEIEILRQEIITKDRELAKQKQTNASSYSCRDSCKNEANKLLALYREKRDNIDQNISRIESLNAMISNTEAELVNMRNKYDSAVIDRNSMGIKILEQNDELCILYEKTNILEDVIKKGEKALGEREEEIKKLKLVKKELIHSIDILKNKEPLTTQYDTKIVNLQIELNKTIERVKELSAKVEDPFGKRCNKIKGSDPDEAKLLRKITRLEEQLVDKEERLLEKELIYDEISNLTERLKKQASVDRNSSNYYANQLNDLTMKIKNISREMMAKVSELSMYQSDTLALYQEKCEKSAILEQAEKNIRNNLPPVASIKDDVKKYEKKIEREKEFIQMMRQKLYNHGICPDEGDKFYTVNNTRTTSKPRPNAYIPQNNGNGISGELPIPKPYGLFAPFKPFEKSVHLRHYRKVVDKPIEI
jgi:chromosome segregation ATPase